MSWWRTGTLAVAGTIPVRSVTAPAILVRSEGHHPAGNWTAIPIRVYESGSGAAAAARAVPVRHPCRPRSPPRGRAGLDKGTLAMAPDQAERAGQKAARSATAAYGPSPLVKSGAPAITTSRSGVPGPSPAGYGGVRRNRRRKPPQTRSEQGTNPVQAVQKLDRPLHMRSGPNGPVAAGGADTPAQCQPPRLVRLFLFIFSPFSVPVPSSGGGELRPNCGRPQRPDPHHHEQCGTADPPAKLIMQRLDTGSTCPLHG